MRGLQGFWVRERKMRRFLRRLSDVKDLFHTEYVDIRCVKASYNSASSKTL